MKFHFLAIMFVFSACNAQIKPVDGYYKCEDQPPVVYSVIHIKGDSITILEHVILGLRPGVERFYQGKLTNKNSKHVLSFTRWFNRSMNTGVIMKAYKDCSKKIEFKPENDVLLLNRRKELETVFGSNSNNGIFTYQKTDTIDSEIVRTIEVYKSNIYFDWNDPKKFNDCIELNINDR